MKKLLSLILALTILSSCLALVGCNYGEQLGYFKEQRIKADYVKQFAINDVSVNDVVLDYYGGNYNGYEIVMLDAECHDPETRVEKIGEASITYYDSNQLYAWKNGDFYTLNNAYNTGIITYLELNELVLQFNKKVTHFRDTGDIYDYEPKVSTSLPEDYFVNAQYFSKYSLKVTLDSKASVGNITPTIDYFGSQYISKVINLSKNQDASDDNFEQKLEVYLHTNNSILNLLYVKTQLEKIPGVKKVELYGVLVAIRNANDPYYLNSEDDNYQWGLDFINVKPVWDFCVGSNEVKIGVIDSGIALHEDLDENTVDGRDFMEGNNASLTTDDIEGHGTHVSGIIGGIGNNEIGVSGINWNISLVPLQVDNNIVDNAFDIQACIDVINYATASYKTDNPIRIINLSLETMFQYDDFEEAIRNYPGLIICGAGNRQLDLDDEEIFRYPAFYGSERCENPVNNIIVVGALDQSGNRSIWTNWLGLIEGASNYGETTVNIFAPGSDIISTFSPSPLYENLDGTSMAAPFVTGVAGLLLSINPNLTTSQLKDCILNGATDIIIAEISGSITHPSKKLNAWGSFMYMMQNYTPEIVVSQGVSQHSFAINESDKYYAQIIVPFTEEFTFTLSGVGSPVDITLYNSEMNEIPITNTWQNNQWTVQFTKEMNPGTYYVAGSYNSTTGGSTLNLSVSHEHTFSDWDSVSDTRHIECCECGVRGTTTGAHVTKASSIVNGKSYCICCGHLVTLTDGFIPIIHNVQKVSVNDSYILPNGIIVLVDEDVEAYMNGTLVFYDKDKVPELQ